MASLAQKLARLTGAGTGTGTGAGTGAGTGTGAGAGTGAGTGTGAGAGTGTRPSLEVLRDRIAAIVARGMPREPRPNPAFSRAAIEGPTGELPFAREDTASGPLYVHRRRARPGQRIGRASIAAAAQSDPGMLALLAIDPSLAGCDPRRALFIDTETTGLSGGSGTVAFLVGMAFWDEDASAFVLEQALLRRLGEEAPLLELVARRLREASMIVSFNGKSFDLPLLATRFVMARLPAAERRPHLDLLHVARRVHRGRVASCTLVGLEADVLGQERVGDVAGADVVACYAHYLRSGDEQALLGVVEHNALDVLSTVALFGLYGEPMFGLEPTDLARAARTVARAGDAATALSLVEHAVERGGGSVAVRARGDLAKARGDKARALADYEELARAAPDDAVRLELAKLYEHHVRAPERALATTLQGTAEEDAAHARRVERLRAKIERAAAREATRAAAAEARRQKLASGRVARRAPVRSREAAITQPRNQPSGHADADTDEAKRSA
jgi:uncharacterized protein YprB with RNaseH-like and TPR domain